MLLLWHLKRCADTIDGNSVCALRHFDDIEWKLKTERQPYIIWRTRSGRARQKSYIDLESVLQRATQFDYPIEIKAPISTTRLDAGEL